MGDYVYCGFWRRFFAFFIDTWMLIMIERFLDKFNPENYFIIILSLLLRPLYWSLFEGSEIQASPGKQLLRLKIINKNGTNVSFLKSFFRAVLLYLMIIIIWIILSIFSAKSFSENVVALLVACLIIGVINMLCIIFTEEETSIPDMIFKTRVVKKEVIN